MIHLMFSVLHHLNECYRVSLFCNSQAAVTDKTTKTMVPARHNYVPSPVLVVSLGAGLTAGGATVQRVGDLDGEDLGHAVHAGRAERFTLFSLLLLVIVWRPVEGYGLEGPGEGLWLVVSHIKAANTHTFG